MSFPVFECWAIPFASVNDFIHRDDIELAKGRIVRESVVLECTYLAMISVSDLQSIASVKIC